MILGILSDTHGHAGYTLDGIRMLESFCVEQAIHCGDIGSTALPALFPFPTHFVRGNVDARGPEMQLAVEQAGHSWHGAFGELEFDSQRIAFLHGDDFRRLEDTIRSQEYQLVCHGHTHIAEERREGKTLILNPGALFRATPHSVAIVRLPELAIEILPT